MSLGCCQRNVRLLVVNNKCYSINIFADLTTKSHDICIAVPFAKNIGKYHWENITSLCK